jgi:hypothetical protein
LRERERESETMSKDSQGGKRLFIMQADRKKCASVSKMRCKCYRKTEKKSFIGGFEFRMLVNHQLKGAS